jgi:hypothetical protein
MPTQLLVQKRLVKYPFNLLGPQFHAGDALYDGLEVSTVEAALTGGLRVTEEGLPALP